MVIGFDASRAFSAQKTGTENYSFHLLEHLAKLDRANTYYIFYRPGSFITPPLPQWPQNFHFQLLPYPKLWTQFGLAKETFLGPKLDVLFVPAHTLPIIHRPGLKTVLTVHDLGAEYLPAFHQLKQRLYLGFMTRYQLHSATHLIAVSEATKRDLVNRIDISPEKVSVIYEGYNKNLFKPAKSDLLNNTLKQYDLGEKGFFLFVGTIQPRKNLERLIKAYAKFLELRGVAGVGDPHRVPASPERSRGTRTSDGGKARQDPEQHTKLVLAGGKGWMADEIYGLPKQLGIENQVKFLGYVPDEDLPALYSGAQALLFPSLFEGFGLPIVEAMACGCPVLTSNTSSMAEIAGPAALLVDPCSIEEITHGITQILTNKPLSQKLIKLGKARVNQFSWQKAARQTLEVLQNI